jgi:chorismate-pyruvate lyase
VQPTPTYHSLYSLFPDADGIPVASAITAEEMPDPYRSLLVHTHHMTVTVEQFYTDSVNVQVLESRQDAHEYTRKILLSLTGSGRVVQFGVVRIDLNLLTDRVRNQILAGTTPLGRVLIQNNVLRQVRPTSYVRVTPNSAMRSWFAMAADEPLYGRLGVIDTDGQPAIEVLEILSPVDSFTTHTAPERK